MNRILIALTLIGFACSPIVNKSKSSRFEINQILPCGKKFYVKDSSQYSPEFIQELRTINTEYDSVRLLDSELVLSKSEIYKLPTDLPLDRLVVYQSESDSNRFVLTLKRINYTAVDYEFRVNNRSVKTGQVHLSAGFFFGEETSEDLINGDTYGLTQYLDKKCGWTCIKVENGNGNRIEFSCDYGNDSIKNIVEFPTLRKQ